MSTSPLVFDVQAKVAGAVAGFKRLASSITPVTRDAEAASKAIDKVGSAKIKPTADTTAIHKIKTEIGRLFEEISRAKSLDVNADTRQAQAKIRQLQATLRTLSRTSVEPQVGTGWRAKIGDALDSVKSGLASVGSGFASVFKSIGLPVIGAAGVAIAGIGTALGATAVKALSLADSFERSKLQMNSFVRNMKITDTLLANIQRYADRTPFEFPELQSAARRLLGVGTSAKAIPKQLALIGDVAAQSGAAVDDLALIYAQMISTGRVSAEDMNQLADRGVNAWGALSEATGKSVADLRKLGEQGKLGAKDIQALWDQLGSGAKGATGALADTLSGQISTLKDTVNGILRDIGTALLPIAKVIIPQFQKGAEGLGAKIAAALPGWIDALLTGAASLIDLGGQFLVGLKNVSVGIVQWIGEFQRSMGAALVGFSHIPGLGDLKQAGEDLQKAGDQTVLASGQIAINWNKWIAAYNQGAAKAKNAISATKLQAALSISTGKATQDLDKIKSKWKAAKAAVERDPANPKLKARAEELDRKRKQAKAWLDQLNRYVANPKLLAKDLASGKVKYVKGQLVSVKDRNVDIVGHDKTGAATRSAKGNLASVKDKHVTITATYRVHKSKGTTADIGPIADAALAPVSSRAFLRSLAEILSTPAPAVAPTVVIQVRDEKLADLVDVRVNGRATHAAKVIGRRRAVLL